MKHILLVCFVALLAGCAATFDTVQQVDESAYLQLQGNFSNTQLTVDNATPVNLSTVETFEFEGKTVAKFPISTGSHTIKITRGEDVLVMRKIYVTNGNAFEVTVP
ncbi:hypothetical protein [Thalassotalea sp. PS06]|uniref:hypothetical protein n=1 Tax=Thalassotalea sp. PS06 TaxID=2594005 RepID=UPI0011650570|nr:hypothetical protein [Thalassotalea sp. PS06]QDP02626.1 hypothetical protein FNC98_15495 [Thalassotalea sp. PS06]